MEKGKEKVDNQINTPDDSSKSEEEEDGNYENKHQLPNDPKDDDDEFDNAKEKKKHSNIIEEKDNCNTKNKENNSIINHPIDDDIKKSKDNHKQQPSNIPQLNFNHLSKFLLDLNLITTPLDDNHKICLEFPSIELDIKSSDNADPSHIKDTFTIASQLLSSEITINIISFYNLFKSLGQKEPYALEDFKILLQIFTSILSTFNDALFKWDLNKEIFPLLITMFTYTDTNIKQLYSERIGILYEELKKEDDVRIRNLLLLMSVFTLFGDISYRTFSVENYLRNLDSYFNVIIGDFRLALLIHFHMMILLQVTIKKNSIESFLSDAKGSNSTKVKKTGEEGEEQGKDSTIEKNITIWKKSKGKKGQSPYELAPTFYYLDNYNMQHILQSNFQIIIMSNMLKIQLFGYISRSYLNIAFNFTVLSFESIYFLNSILQAKENQITFKQEMLFSTQQVIYIFSYFNINEFHIYLNHTFSGSIISCILSTYFHLIVRSKSFIADVHNQTESLLMPYEFYSAELEMILGALRFNYRLKGAKNKSKSMSKNYSFNFNFNSFSIMTKKDKSVKDKHLRDMIITLNQRSFDEEDMVRNLSQYDGMLLFHNDIRKIFSELQHFRKYTIGVKLNQYPLHSEQLRYYFGIVSLEMQYYLHDHSHSHKNVVIAESDYIRPSSTLIINNSISHKTKEKQVHYIRYYKKLGEDVIKLGHNQIIALVELFEEIVIHVDKGKKNTFEPRVLQRGFSHNCVIIVKDTNGKNIDIIIHLCIRDEQRDNAKETKIMEWILEIKKNENVRNVDVVMKMKSLYERNYNLTSNQFMKMMYDNVTMLYLIDEEFDLVFKEKKIFIYYHKKSQKSLMKEPTKDSFKVFIDTMLKCSEMLKYIIDNQLYPHNNAVYLSAKHLLQLKNGSLNIKKINDKVSQSSLFNYNPLNSNHSYPIINILSAQEIAMELSLDNFLRILKEIPKENMTKESIINVVNNEILKGKYEKLSIIILKEKMMKIMKELLPKAGFGRFTLFRMKLEDRHDMLVDDENFAKRIDVFNVQSNKNNFYSKYDIGRLFSLKKMNKTLEDFIENKTEMKSIKSNVNVYSLSYDILSQKIVANKHTNIKENSIEEQVIVEEEQKDKKEPDHKPQNIGKKHSDKDKNCLIF